MIRIGRLSAATMVATLVVALTATPAQADDHVFPVVGTDIGIYPRSAASMDSERVGRALADGESAHVVCETTGEVVDNGYAPSDRWSRLSDGTYLPNAYLLTGVDYGPTPGVGSCSPTASASPSEPSQVVNKYEGISVYGDNISGQLYNHFKGASGTAVVLDWSYIRTSTRLTDAMLSLSQPLGYTTYQSTPWDDADIYYSLGSFTIARTSSRCFAVKDRYDFRDDKLTNKPYVKERAMVANGEAAEFEVFSSGCL